jgi:hypothetical protein
MDAFDKHINSLFENHEVSIDTEELWQNVEPRLKPRRIPKRLFFLLFLVIGVPLGYLLFTLPGEQKPVFNKYTQADRQSYFGRKGQLIDNLMVSDTQQTEKILPGGKNSTGAGFERSINYTVKAESPKPIHSVLLNTLKENDVKAESKVNTFSSESFDSKPRIIHSTKKVATNTAIQPVISLKEPHIDFNLPKLNVRSFRFSADFYTGFDYTFKMLESKSFDYRWYTQERYDSEQYVETFNFGTQLNLHHRSGIFVGTGINYTQIDELFESVGNKESKVFKEGIVQIITNADGSSSEVRGQKLVIEQKSWNKKIYNKYSFVNIPLYLGYAHSAGMVQVEYTAGVDFNLHFSKKGEIIGKEGFPVSVSNPQNSIFNNLTSINLNGGIKLLYPLSPKFTLFAEPNFRYNIHSITLDNYPLKQRYFYTGLRVGTRIHL